MWFALMAIIVMNFVIIGYFHLPNPIVEIQPATQPAIQPSTTQTSFHKEATKLFGKIKSDKYRFWLADSSLRHKIAQVPSQQVFPLEGKEPSRYYYDPRFTFAVYFEELKRLGNLGKPHVLPFHWTDWIDVTMLNEQLDLPDSKRMHCDTIKRKINRRPDVSYFCKNKQDVSDEEARKLGYKSKDHLPPGVIFNHCNHDHTTINSVRVYMAKSYVATYLPKPFKVMILGKDRGTYEFDVDQDHGPDQRMINSGLVKRYAENVLQKSPELLRKEGGEFRVSHLELYEKLQKSVQKKKMAYADDVFNMHQIVTSGPNMPKDITLTEQSFSYPHEWIGQQIKEYEAINHRTVMEQNYLDGLRWCSKYNGDNEPVYFKMATLNINERKNSNNDWGWHYDWRFFNDALFYEKTGWTREERVVRTNIILERLLRNWNRFAEEKGLVSWIMHGPLLSWYWDGLMFPFDVDIDIQMPISELVRLGKYYNQTLVVEDPTEGYGRFLVDVGTYIHNRDISTTGNHIDARFVDVDSGIYIDITGLSKSAAGLPEEYEKNPIVQKKEGDEYAEVYNDRRKHFYTFEQISPLHYSMMGGVPLYVPNQIEERLRFEYEKGLSDYEFQGWYFVPKLQLWVMTSKLDGIFSPDAINKDGKQNRELVILACQEMTDEQALKMLEDDEILMEYYLTHKLTGWHVDEKKFLFTEDGKDNKELFKKAALRAEYVQLTGQIAMNKPMRKCLYEYEAFDRVLMV